MADVTLPGRLGDPEMTIGTDPRADPRMVAMMTAMEMAGDNRATPVNGDTELDALLEYAAETEAGFDMLGAVTIEGAPPIEGVTSEVQVIRGVDGNDITLFIHRPSGVDGPLPGILHLHGGGMAILEAADASNTRWRDELAAAGLVVVGVEFRNAAGKLGPFPFPAGLNDCVSALAWMHEQRTALGVSKIVVSGESGGGNLTMATGLKAKQDGMVDAIDGLYAQCPYVYGGYANPSPDLPSLVENDGYFLGVENMGALAKTYDPTGENATNPLAWPMHATADDLAGLPPTVISVNELDPLRDEGLTLFRNLLRAGVAATSQTINGTCHAGDKIFRTAIPDVYLQSVRDIAAFAHSL